MAKQNNPSSQKTKWFFECEHNWMCSFRFLKKKKPYFYKEHSYYINLLAYFKFNITSVFCVSSKKKIHCL